MSDRELVPLATWLAEPMELPVAEAIERLRRADDAVHIAVMPDVHLATDVCVGVAFATRRLLYPQAVGGDIGCGMLALVFDAPASALANPAVAGRILQGIARAVPTLRRHRAAAAPMPAALAMMKLSHPSLQRYLREEGVLQLGTLGSGNHFIEVQADEEDRLWLMIHSGSRSMGQAIREHHLARAEAVGGGLRALDADTDAGRAYLQDVGWARAFAEANRREMASQLADVLLDVISAKPRADSLLNIDHNHVSRESHLGLSLLVHRKGAMPAGSGQPGLLPGSMGTLSFHIEGRGVEQSLCSSAHGAGRRMSREQARRHLNERQLHQQMQGVWYDFRQGSALREEAPSAYKDIRAVLRAQRELVKVTRTLRPILNHKGR